MSQEFNNSVQSHQVVDKVPKTMKRLIRLAVSAFFGIEQGVIIDYLIHYPCLREDHLCELLKFERKFLRLCLTPLKFDKFIKIQMRVITTSKAESQINTVNDTSQAPLDTDPMAHKSHQNSYNYYYIDYHSAINVIRYKLDKIAETLEKEETKASTQSTFICTGPKEVCGTTYTDLDVDRLFDISTGELYCDICGSSVILLGGGESGTKNIDNTLKHNHAPGQEDEDAKDENLDEITTTVTATKRDIRKMITLFNLQCEPLFNLLKKVENVVLSPQLIKPEPVDIDLNNLANANFYSSTSNNSQNLDNQSILSKWKHSSKYSNNDYEWYKSGGITINLQTEESMEELADKIKYPEHLGDKGSSNPKIPIWLAQDTSNVITQYQRRNNIQQNTNVVRNDESFKYDEDSRASSDGLGTTGLRDEVKLETATKKRTIEHENPNKKYRSYFKNIGGISMSQNTPEGGAGDASATLTPWYDYTSSHKKKLNRRAEENDIAQTLLLYESRSGSTHELAETATTKETNLPPSLSSADDAASTVTSSKSKLNESTSITGTNDVCSTNTLLHPVFDSEYNDETAKGLSLISSDDHFSHHISDPYSNGSNTYDINYETNFQSPIPNMINNNNNHSGQYLFHHHQHHQNEINNNQIQLPTYHHSSVTAVDVNSTFGDDEISEIGCVFPITVSSSPSTFQPNPIIPFNDQHHIHSPNTKLTSILPNSNGIIFNEICPANVSQPTDNDNIPPPNTKRAILTGTADNAGEIVTGGTLKNDLMPGNNKVSTASSIFESLDFVFVNGTKMDFEDINATQLAKMTNQEREIYYEISRKKFEILYDDY